MFEENWETREMPEEVSEKNTILDLFKEHAKVNLEKSVRVKYLKKKPPKRFFINRRIHKKFLKRFGSPFGYYTKYFRDVSELTAPQRKLPVTLNFTAYCQPKKTLVYPKPNFSEPPSVSVKYQTKIFEFPKIGWNVIVKPSEINIDGIRLYTSMFSQQAERMVINGTKISKY